MSDIQSIHRAFEILKVISKNSDSARSSVIATHTNLPYTTVLRMLSTLERAGAVVRHSTESTYSIGPLIQDLTHPKPSHEQLKEIARPYMQQLANKTRETVYLSVEIEDQIHYVDQIDADHDILLRNWIGLSFPMHTTAPGKLLFAFWKDHEIDAYLEKPLEKYTDKTITDTVAIREYIKEIRAKGIAWTNEQTAEGLTGVAAPLFFKDNVLVGAISVGGPTFRFEKLGKKYEVEQQITKIAKQLSQSLQDPQINTAVPIQ
jgi:DNA-binding IclR family transcriptional regulator